MTDFFQIILTVTLTGQFVMNSVNPDNTPERRKLWRLGFAGYNALILLFIFTHMRS